MCYCFGYPVCFEVMQGLTNIDILYQEKDGEDKVILPGDKEPFVNGCPGDSCQINVTVRQCYIIKTEVALTVLETRQSTLAVPIWIALHNMPCKFLFN